MNLSECLKALLFASEEFKNIGLLQLYADLGYLCAWFTTVDTYNISGHRPPDPAGDETSDIHSNNCPIPYPVTDILLYCKDLNKLKYIIPNVNNILTEMLNLDLNNSEVIAVNSFLGRINEVSSIVFNAITVHVYNQSTNYDNNNARYIVDLQEIDPDGNGYISIAEFHN